MILNETTEARSLAASDNGLGKRTAFEEYLTKGCTPSIPAR